MVHAISNRPALTKTGEPSVEPVTTAEMKAHLRVDIGDDDALIDSLIQAARALAEVWTWRTFINSTYTLKLAAFRNEMELPRPPLGSVSGITYLDTDGNSQTLAVTVYDVDTDSEPGRVTLTLNETWPLTQDVIHAVTITFVAGYGSAASDVPETIKSAIKLLVGGMYEHREHWSEIKIETNPAVEALLWSVRVLEAA